MAQAGQVRIMEGGGRFAGVDGRPLKARAPRRWQGRGNGPALGGGRRAVPWRPHGVPSSPCRGVSGTVQFEGVGLRYGMGAEVLSDISFSLGPGSFSFLTGASGAGKTSLLKLLYLAHLPSRGSIRLFGDDVVAMARGRLPEYRRRIGVVFQDFRLLPHLSVRDNVALPLRVAGLEGDAVDRPVDELIGWVGLGDRADARPATLSGGEQQRAAIARAVIGKPRILVADEPTGNVDPDMAGRLLHLFEMLNRLGTTIVVATHDIHLLNRGSGRADDAAGGRPAVGSHRPAPPPAPGAGEVVSAARALPPGGVERLLSGSRLSTTMPWILGVMLALATLATGAALSGALAALSLRDALSERLTVQVVEGDPRAPLRRGRARAGAAAGRGGGRPRGASAGRAGARADRALSGHGAARSGPARSRADRRHPRCAGPGRRRACRRAADRAAVRAVGRGAGRPQRRLGAAGRPAS